MNLSILKGFVSFDMTKLDRAALKAWLISGAMLLEPVVISPGNVDKFLFDNLGNIVDKLITQMSNEQGTIIVGDNGQLQISGDLPVTSAELSQYIALYPSMHEKSRAILSDDPNLIRRLSKFSSEDQKLIVGNPLLLLALQALLPILFQLLLNRFK